jgi:hypothetical protein
MNDGDSRVKRNTKRGRYEVYTRPELYEADRPLATRLLKAAILLAMAAILAAFHRPLLAALASAVPSSH